MFKETWGPIHPPKPNSVSGHHAGRGFICLVVGRPCGPTGNTVWNPLVRRSLRDENRISWRWANRVVHKWGRSDLTGFCLSSFVGIRLVPLKHTISRDFDWILNQCEPDFKLNWILTGFHGIWLKSAKKLLDPLLGRPHLRNAEFLAINQERTSHRNAKSSRFANFVREPGLI